MFLHEKLFLPKQRGRGREQVSDRHSTHGTYWHYDQEYHQIILSCMCCSCLPLEGAVTLCSSWCWAAHSEQAEWISSFCDRAHLLNSCLCTNSRCLTWVFPSSAAIFFQSTRSDPVHIQTTTKTTLLFNILTHNDNCSSGFFFTASKMQI